MRKKEDEQNGIKDAFKSELYDSYVVETAGTRFCIGKA